MSLKRSMRFQPIHNLAQQREDVAAQTLGRMQRELTNQQSKLIELTQYYDDYKCRFNQQAEKGMSVIQAQSYQNFISQLELAITEQKQKINRITESCNSSRVEWHNERQKAQVLEKVMIRYIKQEQHEENKKEQRSSDEFVSNSFWHKNK